MRDPYDVTSPNESRTSDMRATGLAVDEILEDMGADRPVMKSLSEYSPAELFALQFGLGNRYKTSLNENDLDEAINVGLSAVVSVSENSMLRPHILSILSEQLRQRHEKSGARNDLDKGLEFSQTALESLPANLYPSFPQILTGRANILRSKYEQTGELDILEQAIAILKLALSSTPKDHQFHTVILTNLGSAMHSRYSATGALQSLNEAIDYHRLMIQATPEDHPDLMTSLLNFSSALSERYSCMGMERDLNEAIRISRLGLAGTPKNAPGYPIACVILGEQLKNRYQRTKSLEDVDEAVKLGRLAVGSIPETHAEYANVVGALTVYLAIRYEEQDCQGTDYLDEAIQLEERAISSLPSNHPTLGKCLSHLANHLFLRYDRIKEINDLEKAVKLGELAVEHIPKQDPDLGTALNNLGMHLFALYAITDAPKHFNESIAASCGALRHVFARPLERISAGRGAAMSLVYSQNYAEAGQILEEVLDLLPTVTLRTLSHEDLQKVIRGFSGLPSLAASVFLILGRSALEALQILERGRGIISGITLDSKSDVSLLRDAHPELCAQYTRLRDVVASSTIAVVEELNSTSNVSLFRDEANTAQQREDDIEELEKVEKEIRNQVGFERFRLGPSEKDLRDLARHGTMISFNISPFLSNAFIVTEKGVSSITLPDLDHKVLRKRFPLSNKGEFRTPRDLTLVTKNKSLDRVSQNDKSTSTESLHWLWETAVKPTLQKAGLLHNEKPLGRLTRLWWVGGGLMTLAPLHAAGIYKDGSSENTMSHVVSSFVPSFKSLQLVRIKSWSSLKGKDHRILVASMPKTPTCAPLNVEKEVESIKRTIGFRAPVISLENPSPKVVLDEIKICTIVHFACHGHLDPLEPSKSALLLGNSSIEELRVKDLENINHSLAQIAYLSACSTALMNKEKDSNNLLEESIHLASSFHFAGFRHVIGTMWEAHDRTAAEVASIFYEELLKQDLDGDDAVAYALHDAVLGTQANLLSCANVLHWAAFIHIGP
jgi:tetratricopeptide (TPR) repeat protein